MLPRSYPGLRHAAKYQLSEWAANHAVFAEVDFLDRRSLLRGTVKSQSLNRRGHSGSLPALELYVSPQGRYHHRAAGAVITGVVDVLHSRGQVNSAPDVGCVIGFDDILASIA